MAGKEEGSVVGIKYPNRIKLNNHQQGKGSERLDRASNVWASHMIVKICTRYGVMKEK